MSGIKKKEVKACTTLIAELWGKEANKVIGRISKKKIGFPNQNYGRRGSYVNGRGYGGEGSVIVIVVVVMMVTSFRND